jgi:hypothetical protein
MAASMNTWANISSIAQDIQEDAIFLERHMNLMGGLVRTYRDASGLNDRKSYQYGQASVSQIAETDDLASQAFTPTALSTLTPYEYGAQFFITDSRIESDSPDDIRNDGALELGLAMAEKAETDLLALFGSLTGGTIGAAGTTLTWGHVAAAIARARVSIKSQAMPLAVVLHEYQYFNLGKAASIAGSSNAITNNEKFIDPILLRWYRGTFAGADIFVTTNTSQIDASDDFKGAAFARDAIAIDWRRSPRIEPERDASRRGYELNLSAVYAKGVWRPTFGVQIIADASAPSG